MNEQLKGKRPYIKPHKRHEQHIQSQIAIYLISNDTPIINVYFRSTALYHSKRGNVQEGKYNAYMGEMTKRKKTHKNAQNITDSWKKPRIALFIIKDK